MSFRERRTANRIKTSLFATIKGRESADEYWKEKTEVITVSKIGAGFFLEKPVSIGRLVLIQLPLPKELRQFDLDQDEYRVWGLVQHSSFSESRNSYHTGIAFIGKDAPTSYLEDPEKTYRVNGLDKAGFWSVGETQEPFVKREYHRFSEALPVKVYFESKSDARVKMDWDAVTENISKGGASIFSTLNVQTGDGLRVVFSRPEYESLAIVKNKQAREHGKQTIHIEFVEPNFPVEILNRIQK